MVKLFLLFILFLWPVFAQANPMLGVNLSGLEFGTVPGTLGANYNYISPATWLKNGAQIIRVPFLIERMQPTVNTAFDPAYSAIVQKQATAITAGGAVVVLDPHDYGFIANDGTSRDIITDSTGQAHYLDFMIRLATAYAGQKNVAIGLMNEPHSQTDDQYMALWNIVIPAMRQAGFTGVITVPHTGYTSATGVSVSSNFNIVDPLNNWVLEVHQYLDPGNSGTYVSAINNLIGGNSDLLGVIAWSRLHHIKVYVGEYGAPKDAYSVAALQVEIGTIMNSPDVFWGSTQWGAGWGWPTAYSMHLESQNGVVAAQTAMMFSFLDAPSCRALSP